MLIGFVELLKHRASLLIKSFEELVDLTDQAALNLRFVHDVGTKLGTHVVNDFDDLVSLDRKLLSQASCLQPIRFGDGLQVLNR